MLEIRENSGNFGPWLQVRKFASTAASHEGCTHAQCAPNGSPGGRRRETMPAWPPPDLSRWRSESFPKWGESPESCQKLELLSLESHGDLGIHHFRKAPRCFCVIESIWNLWKSENDEGSSDSVEHTFLEKPLAGIGNPSWRFHSWQLSQHSLGRWRRIRIFRSDNKELLCCW